MQLEAFHGCDTTESTPATEEEAARVRFLALQRLCDQATATGNIAGLPVLLRSAAEAQKLLQSCRSATLEWRIARRESLSAADVQKLYTLYIRPVKQMLETAPNALALLVCPTATTQAVITIEGWLTRRLNTLLDQAKAGIYEATATGHGEKEIET